MSVTNFMAEHCILLSGLTFLSGPKWQTDRQTDIANKQTNTFNKSHIWDSGVEQMAFTFGVDSKGGRPQFDWRKPQTTALHCLDSGAFTQTFMANSLRSGKTLSNLLKSKHTLRRDWVFFHSTHLNDGKFNASHTFLEDACARFCQGFSL